ncbi:hypothetical protein QJQ45_015899 [Haematococcus lacustris]|nr:hypothetical protein QJQ45_015899 [Haematococcus lacustris]
MHKVSEGTTCHLVCLPARRQSTCHGRYDRDAVRQCSEYVDNNLMCVVDHEGNTLSSAALIGLEDQRIWAKSADFPEISPTQVAAIKSILGGGENPGSFLIGDVKYFAVGSEDPESKLRGKCQGGGCSVCKTTQCLVVGIWAEPVVASACNKVTEALAEYLISVDY